ncbi:MAG: hypothetical protein A3K75_02755 [Euryarchaeota archaeon RBG_13_61_15]|nr:MAG: hypothetical protein A3K75_02755 [Euryarchaeota archaeon RBG_13_61_15]
MIESSSAFLFCIFLLTFSWRNSMSDSISAILVLSSSFVLISLISGSCPRIGKLLRIVSNCFSFCASCSKAGSSLAMTCGPFFRASSSVSTLNPFLRHCSTLST